MMTLRKQARVGEAVARWRRDVAMLQQRLLQDPNAREAWFWRIRVRILLFLLSREDEHSPPASAGSGDQRDAGAVSPTVSAAPRPGPQRLPAGEKREFNRRFQRELRRIAEANAAPPPGLVERARSLFRGPVEAHRRRVLLRAMLEECEAVEHGRELMIGVMLETALPAMNERQLRALAQPDISEERLLVLLSGCEVEGPVTPPGPPDVRCTGCGYPLHHLVEQRCPECGRAFDPQDPQTFRYRGR